MTDPLIPIARHVEKGDALLLALKGARERGKIAEHVRALRRWHRALRPVVAAYNAPLAESLRRLDPRPKEYARVADKEYCGYAQPLLLMTTATVLYRLKPHLSAVRQRKKPGRKAGQGRYDDVAAIKEISRLVAQEGMNGYKAAWEAEHLADPRCTTIQQKVKRIYDKYRDGIAPN